MSKNSGASGEHSESEARFSLIEIARHRFRIFEQKFQRQPKPHEPIFFLESEDQPVQADLDTTRRQLAEAASASGVKLDPVLKFLGIGPVVAGLVVMNPLEGHSALESICTNMMWALESLVV